MKKTVRSLALYGMLLAVAVLMGYVEAVIPISLMIPGIKLGLANCAILFVLYRFGIRQAMIISVLRTMIIAFLFTSPSVLIYSFSAAVVSILLMYALKKFKVFSIYGVSAAGGMIHNLTQYLIALFVIFDLDTDILRFLTYYLPILILAGLLAGMINAFIADLLLRRLPSEISS